MNPPKKKASMKQAKFPEKPGFRTGLPGKSQPKNRSGGVKKCPIYPASHGL